MNIEQLDLNQITRSQFKVKLTTEEYQKAVDKISKGLIMPKDMISPDEMLESAKKLELGRKEPQSRDDWIRIINFIAFNSAPTFELSICRLFKILYGIPLEDTTISEIVDFQVKLKNDLKHQEKTNEVKDQ